MIRVRTSYSSQWTVMYTISDRWHHIRKLTTEQLRQKSEPSFGAGTPPQTRLLLVTGRGFELLVAGIRQRDFIAVDHAITIFIAIRSDWQRTRDWLHRQLRRHQ